MEATSKWWKNIPSVFLKIPHKVVKLCNGCKVETRGGGLQRHGVKMPTHNRIMVCFPIFIACQRSCRKMMFQVVSVILFMGAGVSVQESGPTPPSLQSPGPAPPTQHSNLFNTALYRNPSPNPFRHVLTGSLWSADCLQADSVNPTEMPSWFVCYFQVVDELNLSKSSSKHAIFTVHNRSCRKVMFSQAFVRMSGGGVGMSGTGWMSPNPTPVLEHGTWDKPPSHRYWHLVPSTKTRRSWQTGGTHPTGMLSCSYMYSLQLRRLN